MASMFHYYIYTIHRTAEYILWHNVFSGMIMMGCQRPLDEQDPYI